MKMNLSFIIGFIPIFLGLRNVLGVTTEVFDLDDSSVKNYEDNLTYIDETTTVKSSPALVIATTRNYTFKDKGLRKPHLILELHSGREDGQSYLECVVKFKYRREFHDEGIFKFIWTLNGDGYRIANAGFKDILKLPHKSLPPGKYCCILDLGGHVVAKKNIKLKSEYGEECARDSDCSTESLNCVYGTCVCRRGFVHVVTLGLYYNQCLKASKMGEHCLVDEQCQATYSNSRCYYNSCAFFRRPTTHLPKEIYKAAMVALLCFILMVASCLVFFLCNRSFLRRRNTNEMPIDDQFTNHIYNISDELDARRLRLEDKPPAYQDIIARDQLIRGVPPPPYSEAMAAIHGVQRPIACLLVQPSTSTATTTTETNYNHDPAQMAGPSRGIVNPNFIHDN